MKPTQKLRSHEVNARHQDWTQRRARGETCVDIAQSEGVDPSTVSKAVSRAETIMAKQFAGSLRQQKMWLTNVHRHIIREALRGWERSQQDEVVHESGTTPTGTIDKTRRKNRSGDPSFLTVAKASAVEVAHLWGINTGDDDADAEEGFRWAGASEVELMDEEIMRLTRMRS